MSLLAGALILVILYLAHKYTYWKRQGIPTPKGFVPLVGHIWPVLSTKSNLGSLFQKWYNEFQDSSMVGYYKATSPALMIRDPKLVKMVLQTNFSSFHDNGMEISELDVLISKNPFFTNGEAWVTARKRLTYAFSSMRLKILFVAVCGVCKKFQDFLNKRLKSNDKCEIELRSLFAKFTGEVVANAGMGVEGHCFDDEKSPIAFDVIGDGLFKPNIVIGSIHNILSFFPGIAKTLKLKFLPKNLETYFAELIRVNMEVRRKEATPRNDFFQLMVDLEKVEGTAIDFATVASHAVSFYIDGFETSSLTLTFIGYHLAVHQDVQQKLREEIQSTLAKHGGELTYDALKDMTYMDQVISESQRHFPVLGGMRKKCTEEITLEGSDGLRCRIKPGTEVNVPVYALHSDPKYWTDPKDFDPERFNADRKQNIEKMTFLPFGEGPRLCVGMRMAILQIKACLTTLLRSYKFDLSPKTKTPLKVIPYYFMTAPLGGVWVKILKI